MSRIVAAKRLRSKKLFGALKCYLTVHEVTFKELCDHVGENFNVWYSRVGQGICHKDDVLTIAMWINPMVRLVEVENGFFVLIDNRIIN